MIYTCEFVNDRSVPTKVYREGGTVWFELQSNDRSQLEMNDAQSMYEPFRKVIFSGTDEIQTRWNPEWQNPWRDGWFILLHNRDGALIEGIWDAEENVHCLRGIPRIIPVRVRSTLIWWKKVEWLLMRKKKHDLRNPDYVIETDELEMIYSRRPVKQIARIKSELASLHRAQTKSYIEAVDRYAERALDS